MAFIVDVFVVVVVVVVVVVAFAVAGRKNKYFFTHP